MSANDPDDPSLWDEDRVVFEICQNAYTPFAKVPNRARLERPLRDNNINGEFLLELDVDTLKTELGIASLGQRKAIMKGIELLRPGPAPFTMEERVRRFQEGLPTPEITHSRLSRIAQSPIYSANEPRPSIEQEIPQTPSFAPRQIGRSSTIAPPQHEGQYDMLAPRQPMHLLQQGHASTYASSLPGYMSDYAMPPAQLLRFTSPVSMAVPSISRPSQACDNASAQVEVQTGPSNFLDVIEKNIDRTSERQPSLTSQTPAETIKAVGSAQTKPRKRIAPTFVRHLETPKAVTSSSSLEVLDDDAYYGSVAIPIQATFYGPDSEFINEVFEIVNSKPAPGYRCAVASRMQHFLRQSAVPIPNTKLVARVAYTAQQCFGPTSEHLLTLFAPNGDPIIQQVDNWPGLLSPQASAVSRTQLNKDKRATKVEDTIPDIDALNDPFAVQPESSGGSDLGDLAYLLEKYPAESDDNEGLPVYGDSDDNNQYDEETWEEMEAEQAERVQASNNMSYEEVVSTIDAMIKEFEQQWIEHKLPKVEAKAYQLWMRVAKMRMRQPERDNILGTLRRCEVRLGKLKDALITDIWHKAADVKVQCQSMEETVNTIFESRYMLKVLDQQTPPPKPDKQAIKQKQKLPRVELPDGEEMLDSDDDIDAFVVDDNSSAEDIPYAVEDDFNPILPTSSPARRQSPTVPDTVEMTDQLQPAARSSSVENTGDEADIDSEGDKIVSPSGKNRRSTVSLTPRKLKKEATFSTEEPALPSYSDSESDSDLDALPKLPRTKYKLQGQTKTQAIDLTFSDPIEPANEATSSEFDVRTPPLNPDGLSKFDRDISEPLMASQRKKASSSTTKKAPLPRDSLSNDESRLPAIEDVKGLRQLDWLKIEDNSDRARALSKGVYSIEEPEFRNLLAYFNNNNVHEMRKEVLRQCLMSTRDHQGKILKVRSKDQPAALLLTYLFMTYVCCKGIVKTNVFSDSDLNQSFEGIRTASTSFFKDVDSAFKVYENFLSSSETAKQGKKRKAKETDLEHLIADDTGSDVLASGEEPQHSQSFKKRKRAVADSQEAKAQQKTDQQRVREQEQRRQAMESKLKSMASNTQAQHYVNTEEPFIPLDPHIAGRVKPHQVTGIQFLWREIIEDPKHHGCLLAHTMGLGKTMQVISLLVTIAQCNQHANPEIRNYIPAKLRESQTLILCPPTLLDNWYDELVMWLPQDNPDVLGRIQKITSSNDNGLELWASEGGVMLMSYNLFRQMLKPPKSRSVSEEDLKQREKWLLKTPNLVIADEAHQMKNAKSQLALIAKRIQTSSRIALTGSPLNNHLEEYHTMVDWIAPRYLGDLLQFRVKYVEPINQGLYSESTAYERRVCLKKLHILKQDLAPKVNRADISAISKDLPSKTEYFITLPLTDLQRQAYDIYVQHMMQSPTTSGPKGLFSLLSILLWLCNHPSIFVRKSEERHAKDARSVESGYQTDASEVPLVDANDTAASPEADTPPADIDAASPSNEDFSAMAEAAKVFQDVDEMGGLKDARLSYRAMIVQEILRKAIARGDKTLLFSHSLDTLSYLQSLLDQMQCNYMSITGETKMTRRQEITKEFNDEDSEYQVCLVSTRAGGLGLNFQGASRVIIYDFGFNPMWEEQAIGRAYRLGQKQPVHVYRFRIGGTIEEVINNKAVFKTQLFSRVIDKKNPMRYASNKVSDYLFLPRDIQQHDFEDCIGKDPEVLDTIIEETDKIRNIELTETFHKEDDEKLTEEELKAADAEYEEQRLQRDNPDAWLRKYGQKPKPAQATAGPGMFGSQLTSPFPFGGRNTFHQMPAVMGSSQTGAIRGATNAYAPGTYSKGLVSRANAMLQQQLGPFGPTPSVGSQAFDQSSDGSAGAARPGAPSPPSAGNSPAVQDASTPDGDPENKKTTTNDPAGCKTQ